METPGNPLFCHESNNDDGLAGLYLGCVFGPKGQQISLFANIGKSQFKEFSFTKIFSIKKILFVFHYRILQIKDKVFHCLNQDLSVQPC